MQSEDIEYFVDGTRYVGHLAVPDGDDPRPAVLVCHEGPGMTDRPRSRARRLAAELGYVAFALDYWGNGEPLPTADVPARLGALMADTATTRRLAKAGLDQLLAHPRVDPSRVAAIGYCFGGTMALELGRSGEPVHAIVGLHSGLANPDPPSAANITGKVLVCIGALDPIVPPSQRVAFEEEMTKGGVDWQLNVYSKTGHSFTNPTMDGSRPGFAYNEQTDLRSWKAMTDFLAEVLGTV